MPGRRSVAPRGDLDTLFRLGVMGDWPDSRLLDHYSSHLDPSGEAAFEALVRRHGPTVWRVCLGLLRDPHAAEDAFQATFLVLARKAGSIRNRDSASAWLCGVARRIALRSRLDASRRRSRERLAARPEAEPEAPRDSHEALLQEVDRLPAHYRLPVVLHDLGGCPYDEVARRLGCPIGTVKVRLSRARALLRRRLTRRGLSPSTATMPPALPVLLPSALADRTVRSAVSLGLGRTALDALPPAVSTSARWMLNAMLLSQLKAAALVSGTLLLAASAGLVVASQGSGPSAPGAPPPAAVTPAIVPGLPRPRQIAAPTIETIDLRALEIASALDDPNARAETLLQLGNSLARRDQTEEALDTLLLARQAAEQIPPEARTTVPHPIIRIAEAQADVGDREAALETFRSAISVLQGMDDNSQSSQWSNLLSTWLVSIGREQFWTVAEAYLAFDERSPFGDPAVTSVRLEALSGDISGALQMVRTSAFFQDPDHAFKRRRALLSIAGALRPEDHEIADEVLDAARRAILSVDGPWPVEPDDDPLRGQDLMAIAGVEAKLGRFDDALETNRSVDTSGPAIRADSLRFNQAGMFLDIAKAQLASGAEDDAHDSVDEAVRVIRTIEQPSMIPYPKGRATDLLLRLGEIEKAEALISELGGRGDGSMAGWFEKLAEAKHEAGDEEAARDDLRLALGLAEGRLRDLLARPPAPGDRPAPDPFLYMTDPIAQAGWNVARLRLKLGDMDAALRMVDGLPEQCLPEFIPALAALLAAEGEFDAARSLINEIESPRLRELAIFRVATALPAGLEPGPGTSPDPG